MIHLINCEGLILLRLMLRGCQIECRRDNTYCFSKIHPDHR